MRTRALWGRLVVGAVVAAPMLGVAVTTPAQAVAETETYFSYASQPGDYIGQGRTGTLTAPTEFAIEGTAGSVSFGADAGTEWWDVTLAAPRGQQLTTGCTRRHAPVQRQPARAVGQLHGPRLQHHQGPLHGLRDQRRHRRPDHVARRRVHAVLRRRRRCLTSTVKYAAPYVVPIVLTSSNPSTLANQPVTLTARVDPGTGPVTFLDGDQVIGQASPDSASLARFTTDRLALARTGSTPGRAPHLGPSLAGRLQWRHLALVQEPER